LGIRAALKALIGRDTKADAPRYGASSGNWLAGAGRTILPPGAQLDYARQVGPIHLNGVVGVCLGWLADNLQQAALKVGTMDGDGEYEADDAHPALKLFRRPNHCFSWRELIASVAADYKIDGNAYMLKVRVGNSGPPTELWWLPNQQITVIGQDDLTDPRPIKRYEFRASGQTTIYQPEDVVHFRDLPDPDNPIIGLGRLKRQLRSVYGLNAGDTLTAAALRNAHTGIVLVPKESLEGINQGSPEESALHAEARAIKRGMTGEGYGGVRAATLPLEYVKVGMTPEELMLDRVLDRPEAMVTAAFGINSLVLGLPASRDSRTYSNIAEARKSAWEDGIVPMLGAFCETIQTQLLYVYAPGQPEPVGEWGDPPGLECWADFADVPAMREDQAAQATTATLLFSNGILKDVNEAREMCGLRPLTEAEMAAMEAKEAEKVKMQQDAFLASGDAPPDEQQQPPGGGPVDGADDIG